MTQTPNAPLHVSFYFYGRSELICGLFGLLLSDLHPGLHTHSVTKLDTIQPRQWCLHLGALLNNREGIKPVKEALEKLGAAGDIHLVGWQVDEDNVVAEDFEAEIDRIMAEAAAANGIRH